MYCWKDERGSILSQDGWTRRINNCPIHSAKTVSLKERMIVTLEAHWDLWLVSGRTLENLLTASYGTKKKYWCVIMNHDVTIYLFLLFCRPQFGEDWVVVARESSCMISAHGVGPIRRSSGATYLRYSRLFGHGVPLNLSTSLDRASAGCVSEYSPGNAQPQRSSYILNVPRCMLYAYRFI
jgi:hypothetical protein